MQEIKNLIININIRYIYIYIFFLNSKYIELLSALKLML